MHLTGKERPEPGWLLVSLVANVLDTALDRIQQPKDIRELYHLAETILDKTKLNPSASINKKVAKAIEKNREIVVKSDLVEYQYRVLSLLTDRIDATKDLVVSICEGLLESSNAKLKQFAATYVFDENPSRNDLRPLVRQALNHERWDVRRRAISGLAKAQLSVDDQKLVIAKMDDADGDVRQEIVSRLQARALTVEMVQPLKKHFSSNSWEVRRDTAILLGKIKNQKALDALSEQLAVETDSDVKQQITVSIAAIRN